MNGNVFLVYKVLMILLVCVALAAFPPNVQPTSGQQLFLAVVRISSFVFFFLEATVCIFGYGLVEGEKAFLKRDPMNILSLLLLLIELLHLTPLRENSTFHSLSKVRVLRVLFLIQLLYKRCL